MVLDDAAGNTWIMKGFQLGLHPKQTYDQFMTTGPAIFKKLPPGWKARVVTLEQDANMRAPVAGRHAPPFKCATLSSCEPSRRVA
jgi:hypothetical protein